MAQASLLKFDSGLIKTSSHIKRMSFASRTSQLSGSTAYGGSSASLSSLSTMATVVPTANIINQKADASRSLYQICVTLKNRLSQVPDFEPYLQQLDPTDPVDPLWALLRSGHPLLTIYNSLQPEVPLVVEENVPNEEKRSKIAIFKFVKACMDELKVSPQDSFVIADLTGNDTSGFVKVTQVVNHVLDLAQQRGLLLQLDSHFVEDPSRDNPTMKMTYRDHIVKELVDTERKYVQDLENLHDLKTTLEQRGAIPGDIVHSIFLNINAILDFQRRFLIRVETTNSMATEFQKWGTPFVMYEAAFDIYQPFIANQRKAAQVANQVFDKIQQVNHPVAADFNTLDGFLLKPMQRLVKYPLLLKDLNKKTEEEDIKRDLMDGCEAAERVLKKANEAVNRDLLDEALEELISRVDDWKNHKVEQFGKLLMHGVYPVITGKTDQEKDYEIYLFECILLCCKEVAPSKSKDKKDKTRSSGPKIRNRNAKLHLKGRIFMNNVNDVITLSKPSSGSHSVQIWWKGDPGIENFTIKFPNEELMKKWADGLGTQRIEKGRAQSGVDPTNFIWNKDNLPENPYLNKEDDDDEEDDLPPASAPARFGGNVPRTSSNSSLRGRSGTNESSQSLSSMTRTSNPRYPMPGQPPAPLNLSTHTPGAVSPGTRGGDSYFSPVEPSQSPASSRASTASNMTPIYKPGTPQAVWDEPQRHTAPAMPRAPSRDGSSPNQHGINGRGNRGPSLPAMATHNSAAQQQRVRSYSTPDINGQGGTRQRAPSQSNVPAVPGIPHHLSGHDGSVPRSQTGSPRNDLPVRANTQSPGAQRERMHQHSGSLGGGVGHYPGHPVYGSRTTTPNPQGGSSLRVEGGGANARAVSPSVNTGSFAPPGGGEMPFPTSLKVKVNCDSGNYVTLVVGYNTAYQSLIDRIDAKLARFTTSSIGQGILKLKYRDEDGDFITISSDDDIQLAFGEFREMHAGGVGEIELFCVGDAEN
ncbi:unnamed protein product [Clonostachys chloroleuca]|uniref:Rho guanine nucleotide exchange factor scd1 n=1 Tax=Clonostachys chloroleuca TaxID=1926264 RepID=A0AA35M4B9_9HYPO|nr:unnamed protein product [Clonostachys chloroleuca]